jgi:hypothetical protein
MKIPSNCSAAAKLRTRRSAANRLHSKKKWSSVPFAKPQLHNRPFPLGTGHYLWWVAPKRKYFRGKNFADPTIKK